MPSDPSLTLADVEELDPDERSGKLHANAPTDFIAVGGVLLVRAYQVLVCQVREEFPFGSRQDALELGRSQFATVASELSAEVL